MTCQGINFFPSSNNERTNEWTKQTNKNEINQRKCLDQPDHIHFGWLISIFCSKFYFLLVRISKFFFRFSGRGQRKKNGPNMIGTDSSGKKRRWNEMLNAGKWMEKKAFSTSAKQTANSTYRFYFYSHWSNTVNHSSGFIFIFIFLCCST